jgi:hypothetical protein
VPLLGLFVRELGIAGVFRVPYSPTRGADIDGSPDVELLAGEWGRGDKGRKGGGEERVGHLRCDLLPKLTGVCR